jgi:ribose/xylose/arabinose/galactoside ABC-type transport system permease subunit
LPAAVAGLPQKAFKEEIMKNLASRLTMFATLGTFLLLVLLASLRYKGFFSPGVFINLIDDNAFLGIAAIGLTFVILTGGIDLSVGSMIGLSSIGLATLVEHHGVHPAWATAIVLGFGIVFGAFMGSLIWFFELPPFLVTLAGMFLARGLAYSISLESVQLVHPFYAWIGGIRLPLADKVSLPAMALVLIVMTLLASYVSIFTRFGRNVFAVGGSMPSAILMGLPVRRTQILVYTCGGFFSALAGVVYTIYTASGNATAGFGLELDAIAAVVIGGTLLQGGSGSLLGTFLGVMILGVIQTIVTFENTVSTWWTKIAVGTLLCGFIVLQKAASRKR